jgi:hypothetical protein
MGVKRGEESLGMAEGILIFLCNIKNYRKLSR